jgi:hypothetical protein
MIGPSWLRMTIRELLLLFVTVAMGVAWYLERDTASFIHHGVTYLRQNPKDDIILTSGPFGEFRVDCCVSREPGDLSRTSWKPDCHRDRPAARPR